MLIGQRYEHGELVDTQFRLQDFQEVEARAYVREGVIHGYRKDGVILQRDAGGGTVPIIIPDLGIIEFNLPNNTENMTIDESVKENPECEEVPVISDIADVEDDSVQPIKSVKRRTPRQRGVEDNGSETIQD